MSHYAPYGWGCVFSKERGSRHCINHAEKGWDACIECSKLEAHPEHDKIVFDLQNFPLYLCDLTLNRKMDVAE